MFHPLGSLIPDGVTRVGELHFQNVVNHVGPVTEAELDARTAEAARIHAGHWNATAHPMDGLMPTEAHDWAIRHIAANLVARSRGYDVERIRLYPEPVAVTKPAPIRRPYRVGEED